FSPALDLTTRKQRMSFRRWGPPPEECFSSGGCAAVVTESLALCNSHRRNGPFRLQRAPHEVVDQALIMPAEDAVPGSRIKHHLEILVAPLQRIDQLDRVLHVDVVVDQAVQQ